MIDDDPGTLLTCRAILRLAGYEVATAGAFSVLSGAVPAAAESGTPRRLLTNKT